MYCLLTVLYSLINLLENACSNTLHNKTTISMEKIIHPMLETPIYIKVVNWLTNLQLVQ